MKKTFFILFVFMTCNLFAQDTLKIDFKVQKSNTTKKILYIEQIVEDTTGVITTTRLPIKDSLIALNFISINLAKIDSTEKQIVMEMERLDQMTEVIRSQFEQIKSQRILLTQRRKMDAITKRELEKLKGKL